MGTVRTTEWALVLPSAEALDAISTALEKCGISAEQEGNLIRGRASRALLKNRWAADVEFQIDPLDAGSIAVARVEMAGTKHFELLGEIAEAVGDDSFADQGLSDAIERLHKVSRVFGRKEIRHLHNILRASERVAAIGQGRYGSKQGLVVLTNERLFFYEKSLLTLETLQEFPLRQITSLGTQKQRTGETLVITVAGNASEISQMFHGQADEIARQFRRLSDASASATQVADPLTSDPIHQLERIAALRDQGIISDAEFEAKKVELMQRL
jgi:hypothetical protein